MRYEIWVEYSGEYVHINPHRVGDERVYFFKRNAEARADKLNEFYRGLASIGGEEPVSHFYVKDNRE